MYVLRERFRRRASLKWAAFSPATSASALLDLRELPAGHHEVCVAGEEGG